jgi:integrase
MDQTKRFSFTKTRLEELPVPTKGRVRYYDDRTPGLTVCITATGTRSFYCYKWQDGRPKQVFIGKFPAVTVGQARELAGQMTAAIARGEDPQAAKQRRREEPTFGELWSHWLAYAESHKKPRSVKEDQRQWEAYLKAWGPRRLSTIKRADVQTLHDRLGHENGHYQANRVLALLKSMFYRSGDIGWNGANPAKGIEKFPEESRDRFLLPEELPKFFEALAKEPNPILQGFFLMCLLTGARRRNVEQMRWADVSLDLKQWRIPDTKGGVPVVVPLVEHALQVLEQLRLYAKPDNPWVFPGHKKGTHLVDPMRSWRQILADAGLSDLRIHDLRRSLGSWQALTGASLQIIGKTLGHARHETTLIYSRLTTDPVKAAMETATAKMLGYKKAETEGQPENVQNSGQKDGEDSGESVAQ